MLEFVYYIAVDLSRFVPELGHLIYRIGIGFSIEAKKFCSNLESTIIIKLIP
jgi:hypothetical protein